MSKRKRILVVDDEPDVLVLCEVNLDLEGFDVLTAADGLEAIASAAADQPDLILLDVKLPHLDGFSALERLQGDAATAQIPVILLTAQAMPSDLDRGWKSGAADYLTKPFNPRVLVERVRGALAGEAPGTARRAALLQAGQAAG